MTLSSCDKQSDEDKTETVMQNVVDAMNRISSFEANVDTNLLLYVAATKITAKITSKIVAKASGDNDVYYYEQHDTTVTGTGVEQATSSIEAFNDGKYFLSFTFNGRKKRLYSENTAEEFMNYYLSSSEKNSVYEGYGKASHIETDTGGYIITLTEYDSEVVDSINEELGLPMENGGGKVTDCTVTITASSDYLINRVVVDYAFSNTEFSGRQITYYGKHNAAEKITDTIDPSDYTKVPDAMAVSRYSELVKDRENSESGFFEFSLMQNIRLSGSSPVEHNEKDAVTYGVDNGRYYFDIDSELNGVNYDITYKDGVYKINGRVDSTSDYNDLTSKAFINQLIDPFGIVPTDVEEVTVSETDEGTVYNFKLETSYGTVVDSLKTVFESVGAIYRRAEINLEFAVKNDEIMSIKYTIDSGGYLLYGGTSYDMSLKMETFTDFGYSPEADPDEITSPTAKK